MALRRALGLSQETVSKLSGLARSEISQAENDAVAWRADALWRGLGTAFSLSRDELEGYLDGKIPIEKCLRRARATAEIAKAELRGAREIDAIAREALARAQLTDDELAPGILVLVRKFVQIHGPVSSKRLTAKALEVRGFLVDVATRVGAQVSHKSVSETLPVRRK